MSARYWVLPPQSTCGLINVYRTNHAYCRTTGANGAKKCHSAKSALTFNFKMLCNSVDPPVKIILHFAFNFMI